MHFFCFFLYSPTTVNTFIEVRSAALEDIFQASDVTLWLFISVCSCPEPSDVYFFFLRYFLFRVYSSEYVLCDYIVTKGCGRSVKEGEDTCAPLSQLQHAVHIAANSLRRSQILSASSSFLPGDILYSTASSSEVINPPNVSVRLYRYAYSMGKGNERTWRRRPSVPHRGRRRAS